MKRPQNLKKCPAIFLKLFSNVKRKRKVCQIIVGFSEYLNCSRFQLKIDGIYSRAASNGIVTVFQWWQRYDGVIVFQILLLLLMLLFDFVHCCYNKFKVSILGVVAHWDDYIAFPADQLTFCLLKSFFRIIISRI